MEMELINLLRILWRRLWLIISVVLVTGLVLGFWLRFAEPVYEARVQVQLSTPQQEDVAAFDQYRSISLRDEITVARNNFAEVLESDEVYNRTISQLGLEGSDATYAVEVNPVRDADFMYVTVEARTSVLAALIANTYVDIATEYYGELRAKPTNAEKRLFAEQLCIAEEKFRAAEEAFAAFQAQNGVASLENELAACQRLLEQLRLERDQRMLEGPIADVDKLIAQRQSELKELMTLAPTYRMLEENAQQAHERYWQVLNQYDETEIQANTQVAERLHAAEEELRAAEEAFAAFQAQNSIASLENEFAVYQRLLEELQLERDQRTLYESDVGPVGEVDELIAQHQKELDRLVALSPRYNLLEDNAHQTRENYQHLLDKYAEAELKADVVQAANFIQIVEPAQAPPQPASGSKKLLVLGLAGSLGFGVLLAFLLEYVSGFKTVRVAPAGTEQEIPPFAGPEAALEDIFSNFGED